MAATSSCSGAESLTISRLEFSPSRVRQNGDAMIADGAAQDHAVAGPRLVGRKPDPSGTMPIPVVLINRPSPFPFSTTFVSPVTIATPAAPRPAPWMRRPLRRVSSRKAFFENERRAQKQRPRAAHRQIVDRAVHRQRPDIAAREKQRLDHKRIGREGDTRAADLEDRLIVQPVENRIREQRQKNIAQQIRAQPSAAAVAEHDPVAARRAAQGKRMTRSHWLSMASHAGMASVLVIGGAGAFGGNHGRAQRLHRRAALAERRDNPPASSVPAAPER